MTWTKNWNTKWSFFRYLKRKHGNPYIYRGKSQYIIIQVCSGFKKLACWSYPARPCTVHRPPNSVLLSVCFDSFGYIVVIRPLLRLCPPETMFPFILAEYIHHKRSYVTPGLASFTLASRKMEADLGLAIQGRSMFAGSETPGAVTSSWRLAEERAKVFCL